LSRDPVRACRFRGCAFAASRASELPASLSVGAVLFAGTLVRCTPRSRLSASASLAFLCT
jgi:hypothetical protein